MKLRKKLKLHLHKMQYVQALFQKLERSARHSANGILRSAPIVPHSVLSTFWSDEAHVYLHGDGNRQNLRTWSHSPPECIHHEHPPLHSPKVTIWCALSTQGITGPMFFGDYNGNAVTVNQGRHQGILQQFFSSLQHRCASIISLQWLHQDGAPTVKTLELLREFIWDREISKGIAIAWPQQSPDLTPPDFFLCAHIKEVFFKYSPENLGELRKPSERPQAASRRRPATEWQRRLSVGWSCAGPETGVMSKYSECGVEEETLADVRAVI